MTVAETSNRLDVLLNKTMRGIVINEYDKSLYLTEAQKKYVEAALSSYEYGDMIRHILGKLLIEEELEATDADDESTATLIILNIKENVKQIVYEITNDSIMTIPMDYNDIHEILASPFRKPDPSIAYRVTKNNKINLHTSETFVKYSYIYCKIPLPIVLENLPDDLEIQGVEVELESELPYDSMIAVIKLASELIYEDKARFMPKAEAEQ